jgi:transcriptional regulator with XRE-family HTH domain
MMAGRKSKYKSHVEPYLERIPKWRKDGLTEEQVAKRLGIAYSSLKQYKNQYSALMAALKEGENELIEQLEESLYKRAMGYEYEETEIIVSKDGNKPTKVKKVKKYLAPDTTALIFALTNLKKEKWRRNANKEELDKEKFEHEKDIDSKKYW